MWNYVSFILQNKIFFLHFLEEYKKKSVSSVSACDYLSLKLKTTNSASKCRMRSKNCPMNSGNYEGLKKDRKEKNGWQDNLENKKKPEDILAMHSVPNRVLIFCPSAAPKSQQVPLMILHQWLPLFKGGPCHISCFMAFLQNSWAPS